MFKLLLLFFTILLTFSSCSSKPKQELVLSTSQWIGYAPLFYAYDKGELEKLNIKLLINVSLAEAADLYHVGKADMVTTTQHEYKSLQESTNDIAAVILLDRSNGGDMILSNQSLATFHKSNKIYAYLEVDSVNQNILLDFIKNNHLNKNKFTYINKDQKQIQDIVNDKNKDILIATYSPYDVLLKKKNFHEVASTSNIDSIIVIDAICTKNKILKKDKKRLIALKKAIDNAIDIIQKEPKKSFEVLSKYFSNITYKDYIDSLKLIKWENKPSKELLKHIKKYGYNEDTIIQ